MDKEYADFGTSPHKLHRSDGPDTSREAAQSVDTTHLEKKVYQAVNTFGRNGCIQDQVLQLFPGSNIGKNYGSLTGRFAALLEKKLIFDTQERRVGTSTRKQRVLVANRFLNEEEKEKYYHAYMAKRNALSKKELKVINTCLDVLSMSVSVEQARGKIRNLFNI